MSAEDINPEFVATFARGKLPSSYLSCFNFILNAFFAVIYCEKVPSPTFISFRLPCSGTVSGVPLMALFAFLAVSVC